MTEDDPIQTRIDESITVKRWVTNTTYEEEPPEKLRRRLDVLFGFLESIDKSPDDAVAFCFLRKRETGERFVSTKRRATVNEQIEAYAVAQGWAGKDTVANGDIVRSFLIHNGIPIGGKAWTGG
jgi:hypothetical protein